MSKEEMALYFDTNVFLSLYMYPLWVTRSILEALDSIFGEKIIVADRVFFEFQKNKEFYLKSKTKTSVLTQIINEVNDQKKNIINSIGSLSLKSEINRFNSDYMSKVENLKNTVDSTFMDIISELKMLEINNPSEYADDDIIGDFVLKHKSDRVFSLKEKLLSATEYEARIANNIGPGITDATKKNDSSDPFRRLGDYLFWKEILEASQKFRTVIFVTNEKKKDFWSKNEKMHLDGFLLKEYDEASCGNSVILALPFASFVEQYLYNNMTDQPDVIGFLDKRKSMYDSVFKEKDFLELCLEDAERIGLDLDDHIGDSIEYSSIDSFDQLDLEDTSIISDFNGIDLEYDYDQQTIVAQFEINICGELSITADNGHFDGETLYEYYTAKMDRNLEVVAEYLFDGDNVKFSKFLSYKEIKFELDNIHNENWDDYYDEFECSDGTCSICGKPLTFENEDSGICHECTMREQDD